MDWQHGGPELTSRFVRRRFGVPDDSDVAIELAPGQFVFDHRLYRRRFGTARSSTDQRKRDRLITTSPSK